MTSWIGQYCINVTDLDATVAFYEALGLECTSRTQIDTAGEAIVECPDKGVDGPYVAAVHFTFESLDAMGAAMGAPGTADVMADVANYTTIQPVLQTSEIV